MFTGALEPNGPALVDAVVAAAPSPASPASPASGWVELPEAGGRQDSKNRRRNRNRGAGRPPLDVAANAPEARVAPVPLADPGPEVEAPSVSGGEALRATCTMAQMRRFIKSRPYVPIHELRRRFEIEGGEDDVNPVPTGTGTIYVGLPPQEARFLSDLIQAGEVGCEMLLDPCSPGVVGVYAMRPVARQ